MRNKNSIFVIGCLGFIGVILVIAIISAAMLWGHRNTAIALDEKIKAQHVSNKSNYDNMWKRFKEMAQVTDMQADDIKKVYTDLIAGRYNDTGALFKIVQEQNPQMNKDLYAKLQNEISAGRTEFDRNQKKIADLVREYNTHIRKHVLMNSIFHFETMDANKFIITSERTSDAYQTGKDDEVKLR
ncbi:hypothetical protein [Paenibacillus alba]|uniref:LemA family protein n=1 Tax=Paenibacillus alba TaxID=1197127 RepID=A0ABU6G851_9BACL|nr:hypothetical protein [Paenibacillus alba]MEC0230376.1 hypothetical protein [Paenibacillus alba]